MKRTLKHCALITLTIVMIVVVACKSKQDISPSSETPPPVVEIKEEIPAIVATDTLLYYERTPCFGMCPIFKFTMYADGKAIYEGKNFVDRIGIYQTQINTAALQDIMALAERIGYFGLQEVYDNEHVTDLPTTITGISKNGKLKVVSNRHKGPPALRDLYTEFDHLLEHKEWKKVDN